MKKETRVAKDYVLNITSKSDFNALLDSMLFSDEEKQIMTMIYVKGQDQTFVADMLGLSLSSVNKKHRKILRKIYKHIG